MKPLFITLLLVLVCFTTIAQSLEPMTAGLHLASFNAETKESSNMGVGLSVSFNRLYIDFASNFSAGKGEQLDFSSSQTYSANKCNVGVFNVGYILPVKKISFIPYVGYGYSREIFQDPIGWDTYFIGDAQSKVSLGFIASVNIAYRTRIQAGIGTFETFKIGLSYSTE